VFIEQQLEPLRRDFPGLKIVMEHITTREAAQYVAEADAAPGCHHHRAPPAVQPQRHLHRRHPPALLLPAGAQARNPPPGPGGVGGHSGNPRFFLGTDSAPHPAHLKEHATGCAGCYTAHAAMEMYAEASMPPVHSTSWRPLPVSTAPTSMACHATPAPSPLKRESWTPPESFAFGEAQLKPLRSGEALPWKLVA
jgi:dihydroorotase